MTRVLVAGVGNIFFGDDGFGVEVARQLATTPPSDTTVADFGIRALHLAFKLLGAYELCIVVDCMPRGGEPGTLYLVEPDVEATDGVADAHGMDLSRVFAAVRDLGGVLPRTMVVGCEPEHVEPLLGLSERVANAIPAAVAMIRDVVARLPKHPEAP